MKNKQRGPKANNTQNAIAPIKAKLINDKKEDNVKGEKDHHELLMNDINNKQSIKVGNSNNDVKKDNKREEVELLITGLNVPQNNSNVISGGEQMNENQSKAIVEIVTLSEKENYLKEKLNQMNVLDSKAKSTTDIIGFTLHKIQEEAIIKNKDKEHIHMQGSIEVIDIPSQKAKEEVSKYQPFALKRLHYLRKNEVNYKRKLESIEENQKLLSSESNFNTLDSSNNNNAIEKSIRLTQLNKLNEQKKIFIEKLESVHNQIEELIRNEHRIDKKNIIKQFLINFDKDKETNIRQVIQLEQKSAIDRKKMQKDKTITFDKRIKELQQREREFQEKKEKIIKDNKQKEEEVMIRRKKEIEKKLEKTKQFIQLKSSKSVKDYLFNKMTDAYIYKERKMLEKMKLIKKMKCVSRDNLDELTKSLEKQNEKLVKEAQEKALLMKEMWKNRSQLIPTYRNPIEKIIENEQKQLNEQEELNKLKPILLAKERKLFSEQNIPQPRPNSQLKQQRENRIIRLEKKGKERIKKRRENSINLHTHINTNKKRNQISKSFSAVDLGFKYNTKPPIRKSSRFIAFRKRSVHALDKAPDYLSEIRQNKHSPISNKNWNKIAIDPKGTLLENIQLIKAQSSALEIKAQQKKELLRLNGGYSNNTELGDSLSDILIDSIKAKIAIIKALKTKEMKQKEDLY